MKTEPKSYIVELPEISRVVTVIGADTYYGKHMIRHLLQHDRMVFGFSQNENFSFDAVPMLAKGQENISYESAPIISDYLVVCIDPAMGFEKYSAKIKRICEECLAKEFSGKICYFSSGSICLTDCEPIPEERIVVPKNEIELALATGENLLKVLLYNDQNNVSPLILRLGVPYGDEFSTDNSIGLVNRFYSQAISGNPLEIPMFDNGKRSVTHIADICESAIMLLDQIDAPDTINIPGEVLSVAEIADKISRKYKTGSKRFSVLSGNDECFFAGDQQLDEKYFRQILDFKQKYTLDSWLAQ